MLKRFASIVLALIMVLGVLPVGAMAEGNEIKDRAYLQLGNDFEGSFAKNISGFRNNEVEGTHIRYIFSVKKDDDSDMTMDEVLAYLGANTERYPQNIGGGFVTKLDAPGTGYEAEAITIDGREVENPEDFVDANGSLDLGWLIFIDGGNLCNASGIYSVSWNNGSQTIVDNVMVSLIFPQIPDPAADRTALAMPEEIQAYFEIGSNRNGDYLEYYWNEPNATEESVKTVLDAFNGRIPVVIDAPNAEFSKIKSIGWNGTDHTEEFKVNGEIVFDGLLMFYSYIDENGNLCNYQRDFEIVWTDSTGTKEFVDEISVALIFPQVEVNQGGGNGDGDGDNGGNNDQEGIKSEATVTGGTETPVQYEEYPEDFYTYWELGDIILKDQIKITAPGRLAEYLECSYDEHGIITVKVKNNVPAAVWKEAYDQLEPNSAHMFVDIEVYAPGDNYTQVATLHGNGDTYRLLVEQYRTDPAKVIYHKFDPKNDNVGCGYYIAQIITEEDKVTIIPDGSDGIYFSTLIWKNGNEVKKQILMFRYEVEEGAKNESFENLRRPAQNIIFDDRTEAESPVLKAEYDRDSGYLKYSYVGTKTIDSEIAADMKGEDGENSIHTLVTAPEGYRCANGNGTYYDFKVSIDSPDDDIIGRTVSFDAKWVNNDGDSITESITIEFDPGKTWMDIYWDPVSEERIVYIDGKGNFVSKEDLADAGLTVNDSEGYVYSDFAEKLGDIDIETIADASVLLLPPDAVERAEGESIEDWINRVYENTRYKKYAYVHTSGPSGYDPGMADQERNVLDDCEIETLEDNGNNATITVANFDKRTVNGIDVWFGENERKGYSYKVLVDWIGEGNNVKSEYFYTEQEQFYLEHSEEAKAEIDSAVEEVTPLGSGWELTVNHFPQAGRDDAYYFQMEADGNVPEGEKTIYIPYSYLDAELTHEKAVAMGLEPKLHHYNDDHTQIELIEGKLTEYGMEFVVESFSPFVIAYDINEESEVEYKLNIDEKFDTVPEALEGIYDSADEIKEDLEKEIFEKTELDESKSGIKFMEITLQMKDPDGNWVKVTEENFPEELEVIIPYPEGTNSENYKFSVAHLISSGNRIGEIDILEPEETEEGLKVKVNSLSPFAVAYEKEGNSGGEGGSEEENAFDWKDIFGILENSGHSGVVNGNKVTIIDGKEDDEKNPETGAPVFEISSAIAVLSTAAAICIGKKK